MFQYVSHICFAYVSHVTHVHFILLNLWPVASFASPWLLASRPWLKSSFSSLNQRHMISVQALHLRQIHSPWRPRSSFPHRPLEPRGAQRSAVCCAMAMAAMGRGQPKEADTETDRVDRDLRDDRDDLAHDLPGFARQLCRELQQKRPQWLGLPSMFHWVFQWCPGAKIAALPTVCWDVWHQCANSIEFLIKWCWNS